MEELLGIIIFVNRLKSSRTEYGAFCKYMDNIFFPDYFPSIIYFCGSKLFACMIDCIELLTVCLLNSRFYDSCHTTNVAFTHISVENAWIIEFITTSSSPQVSGEADETWNSCGSGKTEFHVRKRR